MTSLFNTILKVFFPVTASHQSYIVSNVSLKNKTEKFSQTHPPSLPTTSVLYTQIPWFHAGLTRPRSPIHMVRNEKKQKQITQTHTQKANSHTLILANPGTHTYTKVISSSPPSPSFCDTRSLSLDVSVSFSSSLFSHTPTHTHANACAHVHAPRYMFTYMFTKMELKTRRSFYFLKKELKECCFDSLNSCVMILSVNMVIIFSAINTQPQTAVTKRGKTVCCSSTSDRRNIPNKNHS